MAAWRWEMQLRPPLVLHLTCTAHLTSQTALPHEGKETVHVRHDSSTDHVHTGPRSTSTCKNLCTPHGFKDGCTKHHGLVVHSIIENLLDGTSAKQQLG